MKKLCLKFMFTVFLMLTFMLSEGQNKKEQQIEFKNAPVLFKQSNLFFQQVILTCKADKPGSILVSEEGKEVLKTDLKKGRNGFMITIPAVKKEKKINFVTTINGSKSETTSFVLTPPRKWEIYLVQHAHTDIGYTRPQSEILAEHQRYIDYALDYCDKTDNFPEDAKFRWTCESAWVVKEYLKTRPASQIERLKKRVAEGRIEITGMFLQHGRDIRRKSDG